jgi:hypothetical protein
MGVDSQQTHPAAQLGIERRVDEEAALLPCTGAVAVTLMSATSSNTFTHATNLRGTDAAAGSFFDRKSHEFA